MNFAKKRSKVFVSVLVAVFLVALGVGGGFLFHSPDEKLASQKPDPIITAPVEKKTLVAEITGDGAFVPNGGAKIAVGAPSGMLGVITKNPLQAQQEAVWCKPVVEVSGRPVFVLPGQIPAYRDLTVADQGDDVRRLQEALLQCGYQVRVDGIFGEGTAQALEKMYTSAGYHAVRDPSLALTPVDSSMEDSEVDVDTVGYEIEAHNAVATFVPIDSEIGTESSTDDTKSEGSGGSEATVPPKVEKPEPFIAPRSELHFFSSLPKMGQVAQSGEVVSTKPVVSLNFEGDFFEVVLNPDQKSVVTEGQDITITFGEWQAVATLPKIPVVPQFDDQGSPSFFLNILLPDGAPEDSYGKAGQFHIEPAAGTTYETVVPISAVSQTSDGAQYVMKTVPATPGTQDDALTAQTEKIAVTVIETISGYVAVEAVAGKLDAGDQVVVGRKTQ